MKKLIITLILIVSAFGYSQQPHSGGILSLTGFKLNDPQPIDDRLVVMDSISLISIPNKYEGLVSYSIADDALFVWNGTIWNRVQGGGVGGDYVPLTGTSQEEPMTGPLAMHADWSNVFLSTGGASTTPTQSFSIGTGNAQQTSFVTHTRSGSSMMQAITTDGIRLQYTGTDAATATGLWSNQYHGNRVGFDNNHYVQKRYVDEAIAAVSTSSYSSELFSYTTSNSFVLDETFQEILSVSINGLVISPANYSTTAPSTVEVTYPLYAGDEVIIVYTY